MRLAADEAFPILSPAGGDGAPADRSQGRADEASGASVAASSRSARLPASVRRVAAAAALAAASVGVAAALAALCVAWAPGQRPHHLRRPALGGAIGLQEGPFQWQPDYTAAGCACRTSCVQDGMCPEFPEVDYIYIPEIPEDMDRYSAFSAELDQYVPCGSSVIRMVEGVYPASWPEGHGRYGLVEMYGKQVPVVDIGTVVSTGHGMVQVRWDSPWWEWHRLPYAEVDAGNSSVWAAKSPTLAHHAGCSLSHFITWMDARERGAPYVVISESDALISRWWTPHVGGPAQEFSGVVRALVEEAPRDWDLIFLDKGRAGAEPGSPPVARLTRECWSNSYDIFTWTGEGMAGATLYMVSSRFLQKVPQLIHDVGQDMVDAWIGFRCNPHATGPVPGGQLRCYSVATSAPGAPPPVPVAERWEPQDSALSPVAPDSTPSGPAAAGDITVVRQ